MDMKKILLVLLAVPVIVFGQTYPSPTFSGLTLQNPLTGPNGGTGTTTLTGTGSAVLSNSPTLVTPNLGIPSAVTLTNGAGLPISTGVSGLGAGVAAGLANAVTGSGSPVLATTPTISNLTVTGSLTATGLIGLPALTSLAANTIVANATGSIASPTAFVMPGCNTSTSALNYASGTGFGCNSSISATTLVAAAWAAPGTIGSTTPNTGAFTTLSTTGATTHNGNVSQTQTTAATSGANQSSPTHVFNANYWTGSASATDSWTMQNVMGTGANPTSTLNISHAGTAGNGGVLVNQTTDTSWSTLFPSYSFASVNHGNNNAIIGYNFNDLPNNTNALPIGSLGYGKLKSASAGNSVFGVYGVAENYGTSGAAIAAEFTSRNYCGTGDSSLPPHSGIGTTYCVANALQVTSGGTSLNSVGILLGQEAGSSVGFQTDIYMKPDYNLYGLYIDAPGTGNQTGAVILNNGNGINLLAKTTGSLSANNAVIDVQDASANNRAVITQDGSIAGRALTSTGLSVPTISTCTGVGTGGSCSLDTGSNDGSGTINVTGGSSGSTSGTIAMTFSAALGAHNASCIIHPSVNWLNGTYYNISINSNTSVQFTYLNGGGTGTALTNGTVYKINYICTGH